MKARDSSSLPTLLALAALLVLIIAGVSWFPVPKLPQNGELLQAKLAKYEEGLNFMQGETLAKHLFSNPSARWSHIGLDPVSKCQKVAEGVWLANGLVTSPGEGGQALEMPWMVCFSPDTGERIYARVGTIEAGSLEKARQVAGLLPHRPLEKP